MTQDEINDRVYCDRVENPMTDVLVDYDVAVVATDKAVLVRVGGDEVWLPYSHLVRWTPECAEAEISDWIAREIGLD